MLDYQMNTPVAQFPATTSDSVGMDGWIQKVVTECLERPKLDSAEAGHGSLDHTCFPLMAGVLQFS